MSYLDIFLFRIRSRVCNIRNLAIHKHESLRKFPELNYFMMYNDTNLNSNLTSANLHFSSEKYHLGCVLICDYRVQDRCISKLTIDSKTTFLSENKQKRTTDQINNTKRRKYSN